MRYLYVNDQGVKKSLLSIIHEDRCLHSLSIWREFAWRENEWAGK